MLSLMFLLFQLLLSYSSIFAKPLLTNFFAPYLAAWESNFLVPFLVPLALQASTLYMRPHVSGTEHVGFLKQDARGNPVVDSLPVNFPFSAFCQRFYVQTSIGLNTIHTFFLTKILELTLYCVTQAQPSYAVQLGYGIPKGFPNS